MAREARGPRPGWWNLLLANEALVTTGGQFREVAVPILMVAIWPSARSYAAAILASLIPQVVLLRWLGRWVDRLPPKPLLLISYGARMVAVGGLVQTRTLLWALASMALLASGTALNLVALSHYQAGGDDDETRTLVGRLRVISSAFQGIMPFVAGLAIQAAGRTLGFAVSIACYGAAGAVLARLPSRAAAGPRSAQATAAPAPLPASVVRQMAMVGAVNALAWIANIMYTAYILITLKAGAVGFGFALALWGGAGLLSAWAIGRVNIRRPESVAFGLICLLSAAWLVMTRPVGFWTVALLGIPEGFATWLLVDLIQARVLGEAPARARGAWTAAAGSWGAGGKVLGLVLVSALPELHRAHQWFGLLSALALGLALAWAALTGLPLAGRAVRP